MILRVLSSPNFWLLALILGSFGWTATAIWRRRGGS